MNHLTQADMLAVHFIKKGDISPHEARDVYRIDSFHRRITDLKKRGWEFWSVSRKDLTGKRYKRVFWMGAPDEEILRAKRLQKV